MKRDIHCRQKLIDESIDLIKRQQAEIERLEEERDKNFEKWEILDKRTKERYAELYEEAKGVVRAEAIKEFAKRLKAEYEGIDETYHQIFYSNLVATIDKMVGADDENYI